MTLPVAPSFRLDGRRALVAGGSSGLGLACAAALAAQGAKVTLAARNADRLHDLVEAFRDQGQTAIALPLDISDVPATEAAVAAHGPFDVLVNSAGLARHSPATETTEPDYDAAFALNVKGAYFLARAVARGLIAAGRPGSIVTVSSQMGHVGGPERAVYCATKHAVEGFTKAMAIEWGPHRIRVNTLCPTFVKTPLTEPTFSDPAKRRWIMDNIRLGRPGEVEDIMGAVVWLASDAAGMVTGTAIRVDGGWTAA